ncbi:hypothetical protein [Streptomyces sp. YIM 130001]|uniref:hypothetical protein n=1 Tax=Streptomyces sp. YIM 130001 TaxID=2259644 RepID=UPI000E649820|nr:hypothetical protein [Streptomyces sp. YIM 130001]
MPCHLRFFFEYGVDTPLWPGSPGDPHLDSPYGYPCDLDRLPITAATRAELTRLADRYQSSLDEEYPPGPSRWPMDERELFQRQSDAAVEALRRELGSGWTIEYRRPQF